MHARNRRGPPITLLATRSTRSQVRGNDLRNGSQLEPHAASAGTRTSTPDASLPFHLTFQTEQRNPAERAPAGDMGMSRRRRSRRAEGCIGPVTPAHRAHMTGPSVSQCSVHNPELRALQSPTELLRAARDVGLTPRVHSHPFIIGKRVQTRTHPDMPPALCRKSAWAKRSRDARERLNPMCGVWRPAAPPAGPSGLTLAVSSYPPLVCGTSGVVGCVGGEQVAGLLQYRIESWATSVAAGRPWRKT